MPAICLKNLGKTQNVAMLEDNIILSEASFMQLDIPIDPHPCFVKSLLATKAREIRKNDKHLQNHILFPNI